MRGTLVAEMDLITKNLIVGAGLPTSPPGLAFQIPGTPEITFDRLNHIFGEIAAMFAYRTFQSGPEGESAQIFGATPHQVVSIQPGLIQVQEPIELSPEKATEKVQRVFSIAAKHLSVTQILGFGIKWIAHMPINSKDARAFVIDQVYKQSDQVLEVLGLGGRQWLGMKYVAQDPLGQKQFTVVIEPFLADETHLYIDVDANFGPGVELGEIKAKADEVLDYIRVPVKQYLEKFGA